MIHIVPVSRSSMRISCVVFFTFFLLLPLLTVSSVLLIRLVLHSRPTKTIKHARVKHANVLHIDTVRMKGRVVVPGALPYSKREHAHGLRLQL